MAANSLRWLSNWIVTPILRLGYRPLTLPRPLRTCRAGGDARICRMTRSAWGLSPSLRHQSPNCGSSSIRCSYDRANVPVGARRPVRCLRPHTLWAPLCFQAQAQRLEQLQRVVERVGGEPLCEVVGPGRLDLIDLLHDAAAPRGEVDEFGPLMVRVVRKGNQPLLREEVHRPLHALAAQTHLPGNVRHREGLPGELDGAKHLPTGTGKPQGVRQAVPGGQQQPMQAEYLENQVGQGLPGGRVCAGGGLCVLHMTEYCHNDSILSIEKLPHFKMRREASISKRARGASLAGSLRLRQEAKAVCALPATLCFAWAHAARLWCQRGAGSVL